MIVAVIIMSLMPLPPTPEIAPGLDDKVAHGLIYGILMAWCAAALHYRYWLRLGVAIVALGAGLEFIQVFLPYRSGSLLDIIANGLGVLFGAVLARTITTGPRV